MKSLFMIIFVFLGCSTTNPNFNDKKTIFQEKQISFEKSLNDLISAINKKQYDRVNQFIYKKYGLYVLYNPGVGTHFWNFSFFKKVVDKFTFAFNEKIKCDLKYASIPPKCAGVIEEKGKAVKGCLADDTKNSHLKKVLSEAAIYSLTFGCTKTEEEARNSKEFQRIKKIENGFEKSVRIEEDVTFTFSYLNGSWYLVMIDLSDCSA